MVWKLSIDFRKYPTRLDLRSAVNRKIVRLVTKPSGTLITRALEVQLLDDTFQPQLKDKTKTENLGMEKLW